MTARAQRRVWFSERKLCDPSARAGFRRDDNPLPFNLAADKGLATFHVKHALVDALYALPFGRGGKTASWPGGWGHRVASGWSVAGILSVESGYAWSGHFAIPTSRDR